MSIEQAIADFRGQFRGTVLEPGNTGYEEARKVYNAMIDRKPRLIAKCTDAADVIAAVRLAKANDLRVSVRSGGHNAAGLGVCDDGLVIDLSPINYVRVDPSSRSVLVGAGCRWSDVDHATHVFGLAVPSGIIANTGVAGLTLGGGMGHLSRKYGLTIDSLLSVDMVLADGSFVTASAEENPDLFWAIRGGGGNFGIVTSFLFEGRPVDTVCAGPMLWNLEDAAEVMKWYREFITQAPEEMNGFVAMMSVPPGPHFPETLHFRKMCAIVWCYQGSMEEANKILEPIRSYRPPAFEFFAQMPFPMLQGMFDPIYPTGLQWYWKADFFKELSDAAIEKHLEHASLLPTWQSTMHLYPVNGKVNRVGESDTAFSHRDAVWSGVIVGVDPDPANRDRITDWARGYYEALHPFSAGGAYLNFMMEEGEDRIRATYRGNYDRLAAIKAKYDPGNFFRVNQNIPPVPASQASSSSSD
ncbi:MAG TPA: FAD-binding oxidoreductase [Bryobacteraceae bacterium]|nr:FAD-binding oxidoreductase [Bryobacteraceae bacterium]